MNIGRVAVGLITTTAAVGLLVVGNVPSQSALAGSQAPSAGTNRAFDPGAKIQHVVVILKENHSFNSALGPFCARKQRCLGDDIGTAEPSSTGTVTLQRSPDVVPITAHSGGAQFRAWNNGADNGWNTIGGCSAADSYACYDAFAPKQIPNVTALARKYALSDHTLTCQPEASWNDKLTWGSACDADGFLGKNPQTPPGGTVIEGWGCEADKVTPWSGDGGSTSSEEPSCVPDYSTGLPYGGAFEATPVSEQDSVFQNCDGVPGCTWTDYNTSIAWSPTAMRAYTVYVHPNRQTPQQFVADAQSGNLPSISFVTSSLVDANDSQHNGDSMTIGDNTIGAEVSAVMNGPDWRSTAIFITWDDCGCQYDPVAPNRVPMLIVSPYAKKAYTDSTATTFAGVVRFMETTFGLPAMNSNDESKYDYEDAFDFSQAPLGGLPMTHSHVSAAARQATLTNPENEDDDS